MAERRRRRPAWQRVLAAADAAWPAFQSLWLELLGSFQARLPRRALRHALQQGHLLDAESLAMATWSQEVEQPARDRLLPLFRQTVQASADLIGTDVQALLDEPAHAPFTVEASGTWATIAHTVGTHLAQIGQATRRGVRDSVGRARDLAASLGPALRSLLGLTTAQVAAVIRTRDQRLQQGVGAVDARGLLHQDARQALAARANTISRTQSIDAATLGQQLRWQHGLAHGQRRDAEARRFWIVTPDDRLCQTICAPIPRLNPHGVGMDQPFNTPIGPLMHPTAHPHCRCGIDIRLTP